MFCCIKTAFLWSKIARICKHVECDTGKVIVDAVKAEKEKKIKIKTTKANRKQQQQNIKYYCEAGMRTMVACVERENHSHWSIVSNG